MRAWTAMAPWRRESCTHIERCLLSFVFSISCSSPTYLQPEYRQSLLTELLKIACYRLIKITADGE